MAPRGAVQVNGQGFNDKRGITMLLSVNMYGYLLPPQVIYGGKTDRCHPQNVTFPEDWHITHTPTHWSNIDTMHEYLVNILIPYINSVRVKLGLPDQKAILILDVFAPHRDQTFKDALKAANIKPIYVPAGATADLQPLDADGSVNSVLKQKMADEYQPPQGIVTPNCSPQNTISKLM